MSKIVLRYYCKQEGSHSVFKLVSDKLDIFYLFLEKLEENHIAYQVSEEFTISCFSVEDFNTAVTVGLNFLEEIKNSCKVTSTV